MAATEMPSKRSTTAPDRRRWLRAFAVAAVVTGLGAGTVGGAHAGSLITGRQIKDDSVLSKDVHDGTLTGRDVHDGSLSARDFDGDTTGTQGNPGPIGPTGQPGVHDVTLEHSPLVQVDDQEQLRIQVDCPQGFALSGGLTSGATSVILESSPDNENRSWSTWVYAPAGTISVTAYALCAQFNVGP